MQDDSDESLMCAVKEGSHQAFSILVRRHSDRFFRMAYRLCSKTQTAEDLVQDAFLKIWKNPSLWKEGKGAKFTTWFYRILLNQHIDAMRAQKAVNVADEHLVRFADDRIKPDENVIQMEEQAMIEAAINALPERQRMALNLCFYEGITNAQAADVMGINIKAVESLLMRAKAGVRDYFLNHGSIMRKGARDGTTG
jgi:RNA polymerase sigma-70 factor (ECF subfamily)